MYCRTQSDYCWFGQCWKNYNTLSIVMDLYLTVFAFVVLNMLILLISVDLKVNVSIINVKNLLV